MLRGKSKGGSGILRHYYQKFKTCDQIFIPCFFFSVFIVHVLEISFHNSKPCKKNLHCFQKTKERWKKTVFTYLAFTTHLSIGKNINTSAQQETKKLNQITTGKLTLKLLDKQHTD